MFDHISIGVGDLARSRKFYDAALAPLGFRRLYQDEGSLGYGGSSVGFWIGLSPAPVPANAESGLHFCFSAPNADGVKGFHAAALAKGGRDNGAPGPREAYGPNYYAAYVVDPDGYRLEAYCAGS